MDAKKINKFPIRDYLAGMGILPAKERGYYGLYHSPFRNDRNPSMKVDYDKNLWIDYGLNNGGTLIDFVMQLEKCDAGQAMRLLEQKITPSFFFHGNNSTQQKPAITIERIQPVENPALLMYLKERGINVDIARVHSQEVHYSVAGKPYFSIGFRNDAGGYELRNALFKGCSTPKYITTIDKGSDTVMVFEGFMDFLSYLTLKNNAHPQIDTVVLNSVANIKKALSFLETHRTIHVFFDNDSIGQESLTMLRKLLPASELVNQSTFYRNYKDLNDYIRALQKRVVNPDKLTQRFPKQSIRRESHGI
jgi:DNA primase